MIRFTSPNGKTTDGDGMIYMDEINDEASKPLRSDGGGDVESARPLFAIGPRIDVTSEAGDLANNKTDAKSDSDKPAIGFDLRNGPESQADWPSGPIFVPGQPNVLVTPDVNVYQHKKTLAQGMMDLALLSANANQMRYVLQTDGHHPYFFPSLTMIGMSLFLQIAVGIGLIWNSVYNVKEHDEMCKANKANNWTVIGIFLVTILNVFISSFGVVDQPVAVPFVELRNDTAM